jgi:hypothetical protein
LTDSLKKHSIKEELIEDEQTPGFSKNHQEEDEYDIDLEDVEQKMQMELDAEVDK